MSLLGALESATINSWGMRFKRNLDIFDLLPKQRKMCHSAVASRDLHCIAIQDSFKSTSAAEIAFGLADIAGLAAVLVVISIL